MKRIAVVAGLFAFMSYGILADQTGDCTQGEEFCESLETTNNTTTNNTNTIASGILYFCYRRHNVDYHHYC